jgi:hypothetical protein
VVIVVRPSYVVDPWLRNVPFNDEQYQDNRNNNCRYMIMPLLSLLSFVCVLEDLNCNHHNHRNPKEW